MQIDLDRPAEAGDGKVEPDVAVAGQLDAMLADESRHPGALQCVGHSDLGM